MITEQEAIRLIRRFKTWDFHNYSDNYYYLVADDFRLRLEVEGLLFKVAKLYFCNELIATGKFLIDESKRIMNHQRSQQVNYVDSELKKLLQK